MRSVLLLAALASCAFGVAACGNSSGASATKKGAAIIDQGTVKKDAGGGDTSEADVAAKAGAVGEACAGNPQCTDGLCFQGKCAAPCKKSADCGAGNDCASDDGKRLFCHARSYPDGVGTDCTVAGSPCADGQKCVGNPESPGAECSVACKADLDCPPSMACLPQSDGTSWCQLRKFCTECTSDEECGAGSVCANMGKGRFCSKLCNFGSTECPRYADCQTVDGLPMCVHRAGTCAGTGDLCQPCSDKACNAGQCLTVPSTLESFCAKDCTADADCGTGYTCTQVSADTTKPKECVPKSPDATTPPMCVSKITPTMNEGDIMDDFAMIGYVDTNDNVSLADEDPHLIHLSDFADRDLIAVTVSAGWCGPCQEETTTFKATMEAANYKVMIFQVLMEGPDHGVPPTLAFSKTWVTQLKAAGASGIDLTGIANSWNSDPNGGIPLNIVIDAKTRQVYKKFNGAPPGGWTPTLQYYLKKYYP